MSTSEQPATPVETQVVSGPQAGQEAPATAAPIDQHEKPDWAMNKRQRENARRRREGLKPLPRRWPWVLLGVAVVGGVGAWYYQTQIVPTLPVAEVVSTAPVVEIDIRKQVNAFEYTTLAPETLRQVVRVTGTLQPSQQSQIAGQTGGLVQQVAVRPGDRVAAGDLLVQLDVEQLSLQLDLQRANAQATQSQLALAEAQLERTQSLVTRGVATTSDLDQARTSVEGLQAQVSALRDQVTVAELSLSYATVTAPFAGVVSARSVEPGQFVGAGSPLISVVDLSTVEFTANAQVSAGALIQPGQVVSVAVDGLSNQSFEGVVTRINPVATEGSRTIPVYVQIDNAAGVLLGGMFSTGEITVAEAVDALAVPGDAVRNDREGDHVLVIVDGKAERRAVTIGETWRGNLVQVTEGLAADDVVVTAALPELLAGDEVVLVD